MTIALAYAPPQLVKHQVLSLSLLLSLSLSLLFSSYLYLFSLSLSHSHLFCPTTEQRQRGVSLPSRRRWGKTSCLSIGERQENYKDREVIKCKLPNEIVTATIQSIRGGMSTGGRTLKKLKTETKSNQSWNKGASGIKRSGHPLQSSITHRYSEQLHVEISLCSYSGGCRTRWWQKQFLFYAAARRGATPLYVYYLHIGLKKLQ